MRAIIVDDEWLGIQWLEKIIQDIGRIEVLGTFQNPLEALKMVQSEKLDIVFLDIDMPELSGLEVAEQIQSFSPQTNIVFVTAYNEFAVKAFELHALDYLLKPVQRNRLAKTIQRIAKRSQPAIPDKTTNIFKIRCFQSLEVEKQGSYTEIIPIQWRTTKAQELFAYLLQQRGTSVRKEFLLDLLWPDTDWKKGFSQLYTTIYQVRKVLDSIGIGLSIKNQDGGYKLDLNGVELDVDEWERGVRAEGNVTTDTLSSHLRLIELYRGDYLADYDYLWAESERHRLKALWFHHTSQVVEQLISIEKYDIAVDISHRIQLLHPHREESYFLLMQLYHHLGDRHAVEKQYIQLKKMLDNEFGVLPQQHIQSWYGSWKGFHQ